jgi:hypothetical protein
MGIETEKSLARKMVYPRPGIDHKEESEAPTCPREYTLSQESM